MNVDQIKQEREQIFKDLFDGKIPKRVPISSNLPLEFCLQYAGLPLAKTQWTLEGLEDALEKACNITRADDCPFGYSRYPAHLVILKSKGFVMGSNGFIQHPNLVGMDVEDYDYFIENPFDCIIERILPKVNPAFDPSNPFAFVKTYVKGMIARMDYEQKHAKINEKLIKKYGYHTTPRGSMGIVTAPFDNLADFLRSFSGISTDVRRRPEKVKAACEALLPLQIKRGTPPNPSKYGQTFIALHMATYLRTKDFEEIFWPSFYKLVHALAEKGQPCNLFCEHDWMRYLDHLYELPENTRLMFEYGDPQTIKDKLGKKHILTGLYPLSILRSGTKQQCIDKAKEILDIMAPGGKFIFGLDKSPVSVGDINVDNYKAVMDYVADNAYYSNAGESAAAPDKPSVKPDLSDIPEFKSKYYEPWDEFKKDRPGIFPELEPIIEPILQGYEDRVLSLLCRA